jgi:hypothetical protein
MNGGGPEINFTYLHIGFTGRRWALHKIVAKTKTARLNKNEVLPGLGRCFSLYGL